MILIVGEPCLFPLRMAVILSPSGSGAPAAQRRQGEVREVCMGALAQPRLRVARWWRLVQALDLGNLSVLPESALADGLLGEQS